RPQPLGEGGATRGIAAAQEQREFLAAEARAEIAPSCRLPQQGCEVAQHLVADRVTETVVDALEAVDVSKEEAQRLAARVREPLGGALLETPAVEDARQRVEVAGMPHLIDDVANRDGKKCDRQHDAEDG